MVNCDMSEVRTYFKYLSIEITDLAMVEIKMLSDPLEEYHSPTYSTLLP